MQHNSFEVQTTVQFHGGNNVLKSVDDPFNHGDVLLLKSKQSKSGWNLSRWDRWASSGRGDTALWCSLKGRHQWLMQLLQQWLGCRKKVGMHFTPLLALDQGVQDQKAHNKDSTSMEAWGHLSILAAVAVVAVAESVAEGAGIVLRTSTEVELAGKKKTIQSDNGEQKQSAGRCECGQKSSKSCSFVDWSVHGKCFPLRALVTIAFFPLISLSPSPSLRCPSHHSPSNTATSTYSKYAPLTFWYCTDTEYVQQYPTSWQSPHTLSRFQCHGVSVYVPMPTIRLDHFWLTDHSFWQFLHDDQVPAPSGPSDTTSAPELSSVPLDTSPTCATHSWWNCYRCSCSPTEWDTNVCPSFAQSQLISHTTNSTGCSDWLARAFGSRTRRTMGMHTAGSKQSPCLTEVRRRWDSSLPIMTEKDPNVL